MEYRVKRGNNLHAQGQIALKVMVSMSVSNGGRATPSVLQVEQWSSLVDDLVFCRYDICGT